MGDVNEKEPDSVNYYKESSHWRVQRQDLEQLQSSYDCTMKQYGGKKL